MSSILFKICTTPSLCIVTCEARIYCAFGNDHMNCVSVHLNVHEYPMKDGEYLDFKYQTCKPPRGVGREDSKHNKFYKCDRGYEGAGGELLFFHVGAPKKTFNFKELIPIFNKCKYMNSLSIWKEELSSLKRFGLMDNITMFKGCSNWSYVQKNLFPSQDRLC